MQCKKKLSSRVVRGSLTCVPAIPALRIPTVLSEALLHAVQNLAFSPFDGAQYY